MDLGPAVLAGGVLLVESSEELIPVREFGWILRSLGERGMLAAVDAVLVARPPASNLDRPRPRWTTERPIVPPNVTSRSKQLRVTALRPWYASAYRLGHTRPQWILPYGGEVTVDGASHAVWADYR
jgi:muramoyltetrapeptide carboxypeptidase LdcA involved in peptidoglycan recycling